MPGFQPASAFELLMRGLQGGGYPNPDACWLWTRTLCNGYGRFGVVLNGKPRHVYAHRLSWEIFRGSIPDLHHIDHLCRNKPCCNPQHLEPVMPEENWRRGNRHRELGLYINTQPGIDSHPPQLTLFDEDVA